MLRGKTFALFLAAQSLSSFGDALRVVAITLLLYKITGSGLSAGLSVLYSLIPGILLSTLAGRLGDIFPSKHIIVVIELIRSAVITLFISVNSTCLIYIFLIILSSLDSINNPALRKITVSLSGRDKVLKGNSLLSGMSGVTNILGSSLAAIITSYYGTEAVFMLNSILHALSAVLIVLIKMEKPSEKSVYYMETSCKTILPSLRDSLYHCNDIKGMKDVLITGAIVSFGTISINMSFYPFAFDVLRVTGRGWGLIMSIFYMANILAMIITIKHGKKLQRLDIRFIYILLSIVSAIWFSYSVLNKLSVVLLLQLIEGISLSLCGILLISKLQLTVRTKYLGTITGFNDFINNWGKLIGTVYAYILIKFFSVRYVFTVNSMIVLFYILCSLKFGNRKPQ